MPEVPSLLALCIDAIKNEILEGNDILPFVYKLPSDLFDCLLPRLPPMALQKLQEALPFPGCNDHDFADDYSKVSRKRRRFENFNIAWKALYISRWPNSKNRLVDQVTENAENYEFMTDWQQIYWETHLQKCLDSAAELVSLMSFNGCIGEIKIPDSYLKCIGVEHRGDSTLYSDLAYHCQQFGLYARYLRLQNIFCAAEISNLLRKANLQVLEIHWIKSDEQVEGLCKLLNQNSETLTSLEFVHCKLSADSMNAICDSLHVKCPQKHGISNFIIKTSSFLDCEVPVGLASFLSSARSLSTLILCDNHLQWRIARMVFDALLDASSSITMLDLSENNISGWLSHLKWRPSSCSTSCLGSGKCLQSLRVLNLRSNNLCNDDADCLKYALAYMPTLEVLNLSDNPIGDDGVRSLIPYFIKTGERQCPLADLNLENCELSYHGVSKLLEVLSTLKDPLKSLSIGENNIGSKVGAPLGKFLRTGIQVLDIKGIALGSSGFSLAQEDIVEELKLVQINISNNRGGLETAKFLSRLISWAPELVAVNAGYNCMPEESLSIICSCLKVTKGKLDRLDLTGNYLCNKPASASLLADFQVDGKPIVIIRPESVSHTLYDHDP